MTINHLAKSSKRLREGGCEKKQLDEAQKKYSQLVKLYAEVCLHDNTIYGCFSPFVQDGQADRALECMVMPSCFHLWDSSVQSVDFPSI